MASILTPFLYSLLPSQATNIILPYLTTNLPTLFPPSPPNSPQHRRNYRVAYTLLVGGYLAYTLYNDLSTSPDAEDWYALLGVTRNVDDDGLKKAFRTLSRTHHPDRAGSSGTSESTFILLRQAYEVLTDPTRRFAYDRFGPDVITWFPDQSGKNGSAAGGTVSSGGTGKGKVKGEVGVGEYMRVGMMRSGGFYIVSVGVMVLLAVLGRARDGAYWRNTLLILLLYLELTLLLSPSPSTSPSPSSHPNPFAFPLSLLPSFSSIPQFLQIRLLHRLFTTASIALSQLCGVWSDNKSPAEDKQGWDNVLSLIRGIEMESVSAFKQEVGGVLGNGGDVKAMERIIQDEMTQVLIDRTISSHPHITTTYHHAILHHAKQSTQYAFSPKQPRAPYPPLSSSTAQQDRQVEDLELARKIALPLSPPPSPRLSSTQLY